MIDDMDYQVAHELADHHLYPFAENIYVKIFRAFSHFPLRLSDISLAGEGSTITLMALIILQAFQYHEPTFNRFYKNMLTRAKKEIQPHFPQDVSVEVCLACLLYMYHPADLHDVLSDFDKEELFDQIQQYEFDFKKKTLLINAI